MRDVSQWSLIRNWIQSWLRLVHWYAQTALRPDVTIQELLETAPVVTTHWNIEQKDENRVRFGRMWKCFDIVGSLGLD